MRLVKQGKHHLLMLDHSPTPKALASFLVAASKNTKSILIPVVYLRFAKSLGIGEVHKYSYRLKQYAMISRKTDAKNNRTTLGRNS
jgi:hypothetical protein